MLEQGVIENDSKMDYQSKAETSIGIDKTTLQDIIGTVGQSDNVSQPSDINSNQTTSEKTNEDDTTQQTNSKKSRELKLLLALSKEANLDTNISYKRKTLEGKVKDKESPPKFITDSDNKKILKVALDSKGFRYPVTAESELELDVSENEVKSMTDSSVKTSKRKRDGLSEVNIGGATEEIAKRTRKSIINETMFKTNKDMFCWRCHRENVNISCETCPRSYHQKCLKQTISDVDHWPCPECVAILKAESTQTRSEAMKGMTLEHLCSLLKFAVNRMIQCQGSEPFLHPVSDVEFPDYKTYIVQPMDLTKLEKNIKENLYGSTQAFEADAKWLLHNSIIFNSYQSKLTTVAKNIVKICKQEMAEVENCPSCYLNANTKKSTWFVEVCPKPHLLVWAKLKGFPFWPAKAMCTNSGGMVDVRFFGAHDRAWVHHKECYLFSEKDPNTFKQKRYDIERCIEELNVYIQNLRKIYGEFRYAPYRTTIDPTNEIKQLQIFLPKYKSNLSTKKRMLNKAEAKAFPQDKKETNGKNGLDTKSNETKVASEMKNENEDSPTPQPPPSPQLSDEAETKENIPDGKIEEQKSNRTSTEVASNGISPLLDDSIMEGYGTDDDTLPEIDLERRKIFIEEKSSDAKKMDTDVDEEDNDTQVPSNINLDTSPKTPKSNNAGDESLPRRLSDTDSNQKRRSTDDMPDSLQKVSRRNSDQSVKSDSSRVSNISDKINRVNISENMEVTLGNDDIGCVSISENVSSNNSESSKSSGEYSLENKKKPVQVDIENTEYTISPANKLKISDKLMKRLSDGDVSENCTPKGTEAKKGPGEKKSPTDILIEKFKGVVEHEVVDFREPSTSASPKESDVDSTDDNSKNTTTENITLQDTTEDVNDLSASNVTREVSPEKELDDKATSSPEKPTEALSPIEDIIKSVITATKKLNEKKMAGNQLFPRINTMVCAEQRVVREKENDMTQKQIEKEAVDQRNVLNIDSDKVPNDAKLNTSNVVLEEQSLLKDTLTGEQKLTQPSMPERPEPTLQKEAESRINTANETPKSTTPEKRPINENPSKTINPEVLNIIEEFEDSEGTEDLNDIQMDKANIFNIIHSSLSEAKEKGKDKAKVATREEPPTENSTDDNSLTKKRKHSSDEASTSQAKIVKIIPIEDILMKHVSSKDNAKGQLLQKSLQGKKMIRESSAVSSASRRSSSQEIITEEIKSEPDTDDDFSESENLEAKRKYLSALNISEKVRDDKGLRGNEIRTRSKTEEKKEKCRIVDNLMKTIDDVALNYSANHEGHNVSPKKMVESSAQEGEIFVKSFARMQPTKQKARKSFPAPPYVKPGQISMVNFVRKEVPSTTTTVTKKVLPTSAVVAAKVISSSSTTPTSQSQKTVESSGSGTLSRVLLLPPNQTINCTSSVGNTVFTVFSPLISTTTSSSSTPQPATSLLKSKVLTPNVRASQNYIPQYEEQTKSPSANTILCDILNKSIPNTTPSAATTTTVATTTTAPTAITAATATIVATATESVPTTEPVENAASTPAVEPSPDTSQDEFNVLNSLLPESVSQAVSDLLLRPPPRLKPRPPGMLSVVFDEGVPSTAGSTTAKINSVAHRLGDYFRGMLIETLEDLGKFSSPEAKITSLQLEVEALKHRHNVELSEIRKNMCTILKDIQKSIIDDRERIIDETRAACEAETIKRVEMAKSKQWCANCSKEAQFYCCWNTSYCDYPCQQKHWPQHLGKCTQNVEKTNHSVTMPNRPPGQQLILRPTVPPKPGMGRILTKPTKVYMNRAVGPPKTYKTLSTSGNHLTVIETTPGNYELVGNGPIAVTGKFLATTSNLYHSKFKPNVSTVTSPSTSSLPLQRNKPISASELLRSTASTNSVPLPVTTVMDDDSD